MKVGFAVPVSGSWATPENQRHVVRRAEELGYESVWTFQRLLYPLHPAAEEAPRWQESYRSVHDPLVTLAYLAGQTSRIRLGVALLNMPFFSPALLAKQLTSLDIVAGGRLDVGLGIGWSRDEYAAAGAPYEKRGRRAEEFLRALHAVWTQDVATFHGDFYEVPAARVDPKPVQRPHPPVVVGGGSDAALRRAGRLAQGWVSGSGADLSKLSDAIATVREAARAEGRDPGELRFVCRGAARVRDSGGSDSAADGGGAQRRPMSGSPGQIRADMEYVREQGVTELFIDPNFDPEIGSPDADPVASLHRAEELLETFAPQR